MFGLGTPELIVIFVIILLLFGGSKLPKLARSIGTSARELRKGLQDDAVAETAPAADSSSTTNTQE